MFLEVMLMFLEVIKCSWRLYNVPGGYTNKGRYRAARAAKKNKFILDALVNLHTLIIIQHNLRSHKIFWYPTRSTEI